MNTANSFETLEELLKRYTVAESCVLFILNQNFGISKKDLLLFSQNAQSIFVCSKFLCEAEALQYFPSETAKASILDAQNKWKELEKRILSPFLASHNINFTSKEIRLMCSDVHTFFEWVNDCNYTVGSTEQKQKWLEEAPLQRKA